MDIMSRNLKDVSDIEVIHRILDNEVDLYEIIIRRYNSYLYKIGRSYGFNHQDTEDLMQDTYIQVYSNLNRFEKRSSFKTWIVKIMLNNCYHHKQKSSYQNESHVSNTINEIDIPMFSNSKNSTVDKVTINKELNALVEDALLTIPEDYRLVFSLREITGLKVSETADLLKITESNVKVRLMRAKKMLKEQLFKSYSTEELFEFNLIYCDNIVNNVMAKIYNSKNDK